MENKELVYKSQLKRDIFYENNMDASLLTMGGKINHKKNALHQSLNRPYHFILK
jgi:hypothetical protein